jgi:hypothetical protein
VDGTFVTEHRRRMRTLLLHIHRVMVSTLGPQTGFYEGRDYYQAIQVIAGKVPQAGVHREFPHPCHFKCSLL